MALTGCLTRVHLKNASAQEQSFNRSLMQLLISDAGGMIMSKSSMTIELRETGTQEEFSERLNDNLRGIVPEGVYDVSVVVPGHRVHQQRIFHFGSESFVRISLALTSLYQHAPGKPIAVLRGTVKNFSNLPSANYFVRLVPTFGNSAVLLDRMLDSKSGDFTMSGMYPGQYVVLLFSASTSQARHGEPNVENRGHERLVLSRQILVKDGDNNIEFEVAL